MFSILYYIDNDSSLCSLALQHPFRITWGKKDLHGHLNAELLNSTSWSWHSWWFLTLFLYLLNWQCLRRVTRNHRDSWFWLYTSLFKVRSIMNLVDSFYFTTLLVELSHHKAIWGTYDDIHSIFYPKDMYAEV